MIGNRMQFFIASISGRMFNPARPLGTNGEPERRLAKEVCRTFKVRQEQ